MAFYENRFDLVKNLGELSKDRGFGDFPEHLHRQIELQYFFSDAVEFCVDGQTLECRDGLLLIFPFQIHSNKARRGCRHFSAIISPDILPAYSSVLMNERPICPFIPSERLPGFITDLLDRAYSLDRDGDDLRFRQVHNDIFSLIIGESLRALETVKRDAVTTAGSIPTITRVINYCVSHLSDELTLDSVAGALFLDKFYISKLFAAKINMSFVEFINSQRIFNACQALTDSSKSITEISYECGFRNQSTFNRVFREQIGVTPRDYRRNFRFP